MLRRVEYSSLNRRNPFKREFSGFHQLRLAILGIRHPIPPPDIVRELGWAGAIDADIQWTAKDQSGLNSERALLKGCFFQFGAVPRKSKFRANSDLNFGFDYTCIFKIRFYIYM
jgi:hypothetical protein